MNKYPSNTSHADIHSAALINMELSALASHIDIMALQANTSMQYSDVLAYYAAVNQYVAKIEPLISETDKIKKIRAMWDKISNLVEENAYARTRKNIRILLQIVYDYYFTARTEVQKTQYYFRTTARRKKGIGDIKLNDHEDEVDDDE